MDEGVRVGSGLKFCTNAFLTEDIEILAIALKRRYNITTTIQCAGAQDQYNLYI